MARKARPVIVDTYALMADLTGQAPARALSVLEDVKKGRATGVLHYLTVYELAYHWLKGRLPFRDREELQAFLNTYFTVAGLDPHLAVEAARVKVEGDGLLRRARDPGLRRRRLSAADATTIALALRLGAPIVSGDEDLAYVARSMGIEVVWE